MTDLCLEPSLSFAAHEQFTRLGSALSLASAILSAALCATAFADNPAPASNVAGAANGGRPSGPAGQLDQRHDHAVRAAGEVRRAARAHPQEADELEHAEADFNATADAPTDPKTKVEDLPASCGRGFSGANCGYNNFWVDPGTKVITINGQRAQLDARRSAERPHAADDRRRQAAHRRSAWRHFAAATAAAPPTVRKCARSASAASCRSARARARR